MSGLATVPRQRMAGDAMQDVDMMSFFPALGGKLKDAAGQVGQFARRIPLGKASIVTAAALPVLGAIGDPNADMGKVALESGSGAGGALVGGALGGLLTAGNPLGIAAGSMIGGTVLPAITGSIADNLLGTNKSNQGEFADPKFSDAIRFGRELGRLEAEKASQMAPILAAMERDRARTNNFMANNEWNNRFSAMALEGAINTASSSSPMLQTAVSGLFV